MRIVCNFNFMRNFSQFYAKTNQHYCFPQNTNSHIFLSLPGLRLGSKRQGSTWPGVHRSVLRDPNFRHLSCLPLPNKKCRLRTRLHPRPLRRGETLLLRPLQLHPRHGRQERSSFPNLHRSRPNRPHRRLRHETLGDPVRLPD